MKETSIELRNPDEALALLGPSDVNLRAIRAQLPIRIVARGDRVLLSGNDLEVERAKRFITDLLAVIRGGGSVNQEDISRGARMALEGISEPVPLTDGDGLYLPKQVRPKTPGQRHYVETIAKSDMTFGIGPAGTGKTYLAVAAAVSTFRAKQVKRIVLTRPAVEAGERLGFLPGDIQAKVDPYLRPLYDALFDMMDAERFEAHLSKGYIEVAPLAFMRGRTLNDAFIILDEAQNTTPEQMKMFLTRMGFSSKVVVTGDLTQVDLPTHQHSGLSEAISILEGIEGISFVTFTERDVVRHPLVGRIVQAYDVKKR